MNKNEFEYIRMIKKNINNLKKINDKFTKADADLFIKGKCSCDAVLWQEELLSEMNLYITYLGFLDSLILKERNEMNWFEKFDDCKNYEIHKEKYDYYIEQRNKLIELITKKTKIVSHFRFMNELLNTIPASDKFKLLYNDRQINHYHLDLQLKFINAYNTGFMNQDYFNYEYINHQFEKYCGEIDRHKDNNNKKLAKIRLANNK